MSAIQLLFAVYCVLALGSVACYITVIIQMFMHGDGGIALISLFICGILPFFYGWAKANEWDNVLLMIAWSVCSVCLIITSVILFPLLDSIAA